MMYRDNISGEISFQKEDKSYTFLHWTNPKYFAWPQKFSTDVCVKFTPIGPTCLVEW